jgi:undecaprenyl-diphosphatase
MLDNLFNTLINIDVSIFYFCNLYLQNPVFDVLMPVITYAGTPLFWILVCFGFIIFGGQKGRDMAILCLLALSIGFITSELLKYVFFRPRPYEVLQGINYFMDVPDYAFPSGHSTAAFIGSIIIGVKYGYLYLLLGLAGLVAFSRIYIGVHYPSDVMFGAILGVLCALLVLKLESKLLRTKNKILNT